MSTNDTDRGGRADAALIGNRQRDLPAAVFEAGREMGEPLARERDFLRLEAKLQGSLMTHAPFERDPINREHLAVGRPRDQDGLRQLLLDGVDDFAFEFVESPESRQGRQRGEDHRAQRRDRR